MDGTVSSPDPNDSTPFNAPPEVSGLKQPSLQQRLSSFNSADHANNRAFTSTARGHPNRQPVSASGSSQRLPLPRESRITALAIPVDARSPGTNKPFSPKQEPTLPSPVSPSPMNSPEVAPNSILPAATAIPNVAINHNVESGSSTLPATAAAGEPSFDLLKNIQLRVSSMLTEFNAIGPAPAIRLAEAAKSQCTEVLSSARHATELAEHALASAQQSAVSARRCLDVAESLQVQTDECLAALRGIQTAGAPILNTIQDVSAQLQQWIDGRLAYETARQQESERREALRRENRAAQSQPGSSNIFCFAEGKVHRPSQAMDVDETEPMSHASEDDREAISLALKEREAREAEERRKHEEMQRKLREEEELLERKNQALKAAAEASEAELARIRAERVAAEEQERRRLREQEEREAELKARLEEEARQKMAAQRRAVQERASQVVKEKQRAEFSQKEAIRDQEPKGRLPTSSDPQNLEVLQRRLAAERASAQMTMRPQGEQHTDLPAAASPLSRKSILPASSLPTSPNTRDVGNIVSRKTLLAANSNSDRKQSLPISGNVPLSGVGSSSTPAVTQSPPVSNSFQPSNAPPKQILNSLPPKPGSLPLPTRSGVRNDAVDSRFSRENSSLKTASPAVPPTQKPNQNFFTSQPAKSPEIDDEPIPGLSNYPRQPQASAVATEVSVNAMGPDLGNAPLLRRQHVPPVSPDAQKANLRGLIGATATPVQQTVKHEADEQKPPTSARGVLAPSSANGSTKESTSNPDPSSKALKTEPQDDIPLQQLYASATLLPNQTATAANPASQPPPAGLRAIPSTQRPPEVGRYDDVPRVAVPPGLEMARDNDFENRMSSTVAGALPSHPSSVGRSPQTPSIPLPVRLPSNLAPSMIPSRSAPEIAHRTSAANTFDDNSRMGPDTSIGSGWSQQNLLEEELPPSRPLSRSGSGRLNGDHYSPSPAPYVPLNNRNNRNIRRRIQDRHGDHWSPDRAGYSPPPSRSRSHSGNHSRGVSPIQRYEPVHTGRPHSPDRIPSRAASPVAGQKRAREDYPVAGPSNRRARYDEPQARPSDARNDSRLQASTGYDNGYREEWSHSAAYAPSPSPPREPPRAPAPLAERIAAGAEHDMRSQGPPRHRHLDPRRPPYSRPPPRGTGPSPTRHYRGPRNDARPQLLNRFTDTAAERPQQRPPPPLEDRIAGKNSLINRLM